MDENTADAILRALLALGIIALATVVGVVIGLRFAHDALTCIDRVVETGQCVAYVLEAV